ncbi:hypothetical protein D5086_012888 [Populus alba]|uniref:Uncharacterized protein n=1 Tax=Populus alba TaxID=43335 RepID=A0ACC4C3P5_POPAL
MEIEHHRGFDSIITTEKDDKISAMDAVLGSLDPSMHFTRGNCEASDVPQSSRPTVSQAPYTPQPWQPTTTTSSHLQSTITVKDFPTATSTVTNSGSSSIQLRQFLCTVILVVSNSSSCSNCLKEQQQCSVTSVPLSSVAIDIFLSCSWFPLKHHRRAALHQQ